MATSTVTGGAPCRVPRGGRKKNSQWGLGNRAIDDTAVRGPTC
jgi:hypothetical protein